MLGPTPAIPKARLVPTPGVYIPARGLQAGGLRWDCRHRRSFDAAPCTCQAFHQPRPGLPPLRTKEVSSRARTRTGRKLPFPPRCPAGPAGLLLAPDALERRQAGLHIKAATGLRVALDGMASGSDELRAALDRAAPTRTLRGVLRYPALSLPSPQTRLSVRDNPSRRHWRQVRQQHRACVEPRLSARFRDSVSVGSVPLSPLGREPEGEPSRFLAKAT